MLARDVQEGITKDKTTKTLMCEKYKVPHRAQLHIIPSVQQWVPQVRKPLGKCSQISFCYYFLFQLERRTIVKKIEVKADVVYIYLEKVSGNKNIWFDTVRARSQRTRNCVRSPRLDEAWGKSTGRTVDRGSLPNLISIGLAFAIPHTYS